MAFAPPNAQPKILTERERRRRDRQSILTALLESRGKVSGSGGAAERLGVKPTTLASRMKALGISRHDVQVHPDVS